MYTKAELKMLWPGITDENFKPAEVSNDKNVNPPLYTDGIIEKFNQVLPIDPQTGHADDLLQYVMSRNDETSEYLKQFLSTKVTQRQPKLTDEELLQFLVPKNIQSAGELDVYRAQLEAYLQHEIAKDEKVLREAAKAQEGSKDKDQETQAEGNT